MGYRTALGVIFVFQAQRRGGAEVFSFRREGEFFKEIFKGVQEFRSDASLRSADNTFACIFACFRPL